MKEDEHTQFWVYHAVFDLKKKKENIIFVSFSFFKSFIPRLIYESSEQEKNLIFYGVERIIIITKCLCASLTFI